MSNFGQAALTIVGTVVGSFFGFPQLGFVLGSLAGQALFPTQLPGVSGPRLQDVKNTTGTVGLPVMEVFGIDCVPGNIIYLGPVTEIANTSTAGGKGGPEQEQTTYTYFQTIAIGLCRGPQAGIRRIWENGKLVYDTRPERVNTLRENLEGLHFSDEGPIGVAAAEAFNNLVSSITDYQDTFVLYLGDEEQLPDPTLEAELGAGEVPAFRGLMYIVFPNRQLKEDQGLRHPNFKFEIAEPGEISELVEIRDGELQMISGAGNTSLFPVGDLYRGYVSAEASGSVLAGFTPASFGSMPGGALYQPSNESARYRIVGLYYDHTVDVPEIGDGDLYLVMTRDDTTALPTDDAWDSMTIGGITYSRLTDVNLIQSTGNYKLWRMPVGEGDAIVANTSYIISFEPFNELGGIPAASLVTVDVPTPLSQIVTAICSRVGIPSDNVDATDLEDRSVMGYVLTRVMTGLDAIEPLRKVGFFDIVESGTKLKFVTRGKGHVRELFEDDIGANDGAADKPPVAMTTRTMQDVELPRQIRIHYRNQARDYEEDEELSPSRIITAAVNDVDIEVPVTMSNQQAAEIAEVLWAEAWAGRFIHKTSVDHTHMDLEPADVVLIPVDESVQRVRILSIDDSSLIVRKLELARDDDGSYVPAARSQAPLIELAAMEIISGTLLTFLDVPALATTDTDAGFYLAACRSGDGDTWRGATILRSVDGGVTFETVGSITTEAPVGTVVSALGVGDLPIGSPVTWDDDNTLVVELFSSSMALESRLENDVLAGANHIAIGNNGAWEIIGFANAVQISPVRWQLSHLLRGRRGTEHMLGYSQAGDSFALLTGGIIKIPLTISQRFQDYIYRAVSVGRPNTDANEFTYAGIGRSLIPFSPVNIVGSLEGDGDVLISWNGRDRLGQELTFFVDPESDPPTTFDVVISGVGSPSVTVRTFSGVSGEQQLYTLAQQTADFGTPQAFNVDVYQVSPTVGRGFVGQAFITLGLSGTASLTFTPTGRLKGRGALRGSASLTFGASGSLSDANSGADTMEITSQFDEISKRGYVAGSAGTLNVNTTTHVVKGIYYDEDFTTFIITFDLAGGIDAPPDVYDRVEFIDNTSTLRVLEFSAAATGIVGGVRFWNWSSPSETIGFSDGEDYTLNFYASP